MQQDWRVSSAAIQSDYVDGMSLYRSYFVPRSVDPFGLFGDPLPKKCKVPPDDCFTLIEKMGRFADDFAKRLAEWIADKHDIRGLINHENYNPTSIKNHYDLLFYTAEQAAECYFLAKEHCKCFPVPHPRLDPLPEYPKHPLKIDRPVYVDCRRALPRQTPWGPADPWECPDVWIEPGDIENLGPIAVGCGGRNYHLHSR